MRVRELKSNITFSDGLKKNFVAVDFRWY